MTLPPVSVIILFTLGPTKVVDKAYDNIYSVQLPDNPVADSYILKLFKAYSFTVGSQLPVLPNDSVVLKVKADRTSFTAPVAITVSVPT